MTQVVSLYTWFEPHFSMLGSRWVLGPLHICAHDTLWTPANLRVKDHAGMLVRKAGCRLRWPGFKPCVLPFTSFVTLGRLNPPCSVSAMKSANVHFQRCLSPSRWSVNLAFFFFLVYSMDNLKVTWFHVFLRGFTFKLTCIQQQAQDLTAESRKLEMCQAMEESILGLKFCCRKSTKWTFVCADGWELALPDLSTYLNLKGILWFQIVQPRLRMWHVTFSFFVFLRTWLLYVLEPKPLATPNSWDWRSNRESLMGSCQPVSWF